MWQIRIGNAQWHSRPTGGPRSTLAAVALVAVALALLAPLAVVALLALLAGVFVVLLALAALRVMRLAALGWQRLTGRLPFLARAPHDDGRRNVRVLHRQDD
jgi:uncharacterized membrane protein